MIEAGRRIAEQRYASTAPEVIGGNVIRKQACIGGIDSHVIQWDEFLPMFRVAGVATKGPSPARSR
jgi:hypothetical protein